MTLKPWASRQLKTHLGGGEFTLYGNVDAAFAPTVQSVMVGLVCWLVCCYLYQRRFFIRI